MSDVFLKLYKDKTDRQKRVGEWFTDNVQPLLERSKLHSINLEIGCGHGHWLTSLAMTNPKMVYIGIDLITKRIERANTKKSKNNLNNVFFCKAEAFEFIESAEVKISTTFIMYPDPWPKKRHQKRRLIQNHFLKLLALKSTSSGEFYFMTDHSGYFKWATSMVTESTYWKIIDKKWPHEAKSYFSDLLPNNHFFCAQKL